MEQQLNRIELRGHVGNVRVRQFENNNSVANFSLVTNFMYKSKEGNGVVETMWHNVVAWSGKGMPEDLNSITKGSSVYVVGRLRNSSYINSDGEHRNYIEVVASQVSFEENNGAQTAIF